MQRAPSFAGSEVGSYRIEEQLGAGGMGAVYRAFDQRLERSVALKQVLPEKVESDLVRKRFQREARSAARLSHPGIVRVHDVLESDGCDWIVMELVEGETLARLLVGGPLVPERALRLGAEIGDALAAAHAEGIVHRDLKAKNVLITADGQPKISDFGLAKQVIHREGTSTTISMEGQLLGTPQAMSPEQAMGRRVDLRSDLFSLGSLLYEMTTGVAPFRADNPLETMTRVCTHQPPSVRHHVPALPRAFADLVERLLEKDPAHRPRSAGEVAMELRRIADAPLVEEPSADAALTLDDAETLGGATAMPTDADGPRSHAERRQVTVMCCELVAAASSGALDPETAYAATADFEDLVRKTAERFEGFVANVLGHRLVVYFGYPQAHDDDAWRAVSAALELATRCSDLGFAVRVGIHTGPAVVLGRATQREQLAPGQTLDLATSLQRLAEPGCVLATDVTHRLIEGTCTSEVWPAQALGFTSAPVFQIHEVKDTSNWQFRRRPTPLVAREHEIEILLDRWRLARQGSGQVVLLSGEPGIGKSRLLYTLKERLSEEPSTWLDAFGSSHAQNTPLYPIVELLRRTWRLNQEDAHPKQLTRLEQELSCYGLGHVDVAPLFAALLGLPSEGHYPSLNLSPKKQREKTLEALLTLFLEMTRRRPLVLVVEDLHWVDPSTVELLALLVERCAVSSLLLVLSFRLEFEPPWEHPAHLSQLGLSRLAGSEVEALIDRVTDGCALPAEVRDQIVAKTDGVPLFVEEMTKNLLESGLLIEQGGRYDLAGSLEDLAIPATLRDSLTARLDRLGPTKKIAQLAAVMGREFPCELLMAVAPFEESAVEQALDHLVEMDFVYSKGFSSRRRYFFKHALIQDAAYESLLQQHRQRYHKEIAQALEKLFLQIVESQPELVAHHFTEALCYEPAVDYWRRAGELNFQRSAIFEATEHVDRGLALLYRLPETPKRERQELALQAVRAWAIGATRGFASVEAEQAHHRALELCQKSTDAPELFWVLWGLWRFHSVRANYHEARDISNHLLRLAEPQTEPVQTLAAYFCAGSTLFCQGEFEASLEYLEEGIRCDDLDRSWHYAHSTSQDPGVFNLSVSARCLWFLGYPDRARKRCDEATALARRISHPFSLTHSLHCAMMLSYDLRDRSKHLELAKRIVRMSREQGSYWEEATQILVDLESVVNTAETGRRQRDTYETLDALRQILAGRIAKGTRHFQSLYASILAQGWARHGYVKQGSRVLDEALRHVVETREGLYHAEILRLRGQLARQSGRCRQAEDYYRRAIGIARQQSAKSLELRAACSLSELWMQQGELQRAQDFLRNTYDWFTEGFDTVDLTAARSLLDCPP